MTATSYAATSCDYGGEIKSIEAVDDMTVKFTLCQPDVAFPSKAAFSAFGIHPSEQLEATGGTGELLDKLIGTGPYMVDKWQKGDSIIFKANPNYWGDKAKADELVFRWSKEGAARLLELQAGTVDGIDNPTPDDFKTIESDTNLKLYPREALNIFYLGMSNTQPPFDKEEVRQAVAMGIDRQRIVDNFYPVGSVVASHFTPCAIPGGCEGEEWYKFDPKAAKELLAKAGFPDGFKTTLSYRDVVRSYLPQPGLVAQDIQAQLKENLNIDVEINVMESGAFLDTAKTGSLPLHLLGWGADYPDQTNFLDYHFGKGAPAQFGKGFEDLWAVLEKAATTADAGRAREAVRRGQQPGQEARPDGARGPRRLRDRFQGRRDRRACEPAGQRELLRDAAGRPQAVGLDAERRTAQPLLRGRGRRRIAARMRAGRANRCWPTRSAAPTSSLRWPSRTRPNADLTEWTFKLRPNVKFHDGSAFDAKDVITSWAVQWDAAQPAPQGPHRHLHLLQRAVRGVPERTAGTVMS